MSLPAAYENAARFTENNLTDYEYRDRDGAQLALVASPQPEHRRDFVAELDGRPRSPVPGFRCALIYEDPSNSECFECLRR